MPPTSLETILVVDDNSIVLSMTKAMLTRYDYRVISFLSGKQAIEFLGNCEDSDICLALIDVVMKDMDGPETARRILRLKPGLPIILMTGFPEHEEFLAARGQVVLRKPFTSVTLVRKIRETLKQPRSGDSALSATEG